MKNLFTSVMVLFVLLAISLIIISCSKKANSTLFTTWKGDYLKTTYAGTYSTTDLTSTTVTFFKNNTFSMSIRGISPYTLKDTVTQLDTTYVLKGDTIIGSIAEHIDSFLITKLSASQLQLVCLNKIMIGNYQQFTIIASPSSSVQGDNTINLQNIIAGLNIQMLFVFKR